MSLNSCHHIALSQTWPCDHVILIKLHGLEQIRCMITELNQNTGERERSGQNVQRSVTTHLSHSDNNTCKWRILCWKGIAAVVIEILPWNILSQNIMYCCLYLNYFLGSVDLLLFVGFVTFLSDVSTFFKCSVSNCFFLHQVTSQNQPAACLALVYSIVQCNCYLTF